MIYTAYYLSPLGKILLAQEGDALIGLWLESQPVPKMILQETMQTSTPLLSAAANWLDRYFAGKAPTPDELPLTPKGTVFQQEVWKLLCEIPYGQVTTYKQIAKAVAQRLGKPRMSAQAVGGAVGRNPISIIIPCHRIIGSDGSLTGYAGGLEMKKFLLCHEERKEP